MPYENEQISFVNKFSPAVLLSHMKNKQILSCGLIMSYENKQIISHCLIT